MEWGTAGLHGSEQVADINRNARPTSSALGVRMKSIVSIPPATNARTVLGSVSIRRFDVKARSGIAAPRLAATSSADRSRVKYLKKGRRTMNRQSIFSLSVAALALRLLPTNAVAKKPGTTPPPSNVVIPEGYSMTAVATGLNFPTAMTFFGDTIWVTEMGNTTTSPAAVKEIDSRGNITTMLTADQLPDGTLRPPLTGI